MTLQHKNMMQSFERIKGFNVDHPVRIEFGSGKSSELGQLCSLYGKRVFVVTMKELENLGLLENAIQSLEKEQKIDANNSYRIFICVLVNGVRLIDNILVK